MKITGKVQYQNIGPGFWGIVSSNGEEWRPVNMPEQLKYEGAKISVYGREVDEMSIFMWGKAIRITSFSTIGVK